MQGTLFKSMRINNQFLFSDYYLEELLPKNDDFQSNDEIKRIYKEITDTYTRQRNNLHKHLEGGLEKDFIQPILDLLGHIYEYQSPLPAFDGVVRPDYAFFESEKDKNAALQYKGKREFWSKAIAVGDAKLWDRKLDKKLKGSGNPFDNQNPSYQIDYYLRESDKKWGILTNGRFWRLYNKENSYKLGIYYEVDLPAIIEQENIEDFKYFYLFFRKHAFLRVQTEDCFLDRVFKGSVDYAKAIGEKLKENVYEALRVISEGFLKRPDNNLEHADLDIVHDNALVYLYRLLFILFAESRGLLPIASNNTYRQFRSLQSLKEAIAHDKDNFLNTGSRCWDHLAELFFIINTGDSLLNVPAYNGGLFDPFKHPFLDEKVSMTGETVRKVPDNYLAEVIDLLARTEEGIGVSKAFVDYRSLNVQHLGSIYEGLLEYKVRHADKDLMVVKEAKKETYVAVGEKLTKGQKDTGKRIKSGDVYLATDKGERKATGSYYTPEYIVEYIVRNTLGPLCNEIDEKIKKDINEVEGKVKASRGVNRETYEKNLHEVKTSYDDEVLKIKVLDPAMGSGHFLVSAVEHLAEQIATHPYAHDDDAPDDETAIDYWKRKVVENCIYGVDINPLAVELAKLSLWLKTVSKNKPLSFLDHHLRCGNSLVGATLEDLRNPPILKKGKKQIEPLTLFDENRFTRDVSLLVGDYKVIERMPSNTVEQIKDKERILREEIETRREKYIKQADLWTSAFYGNHIEPNIYRDLVRYIAGDESQVAKEQAKPYLEKAEELRRYKHFFHWELEFPEVFFDESGKKKKYSGFDVVIGNPPWGVEFNIEEKKYNKFFFDQIIVRMIDSFMFFIYRGKLLTRLGGLESLIVPSPFFLQVDIKKLRRWLLDERIIVLLNLGDGIFGQNVTAPCCIFILRNEECDYKEHKVHVSDFTQLPLMQKVRKLKQGELDYKEIPQEFYLNAHNFSFITKGFESTELFEKISDIGKHLSDLIDGNIQRGISCDLNDAFIMNDSSKHETEVEPQICIPVIMGQDVSRYLLTWGRNYILYLTRNDDIEEFPQAKVHLEKFRNRITCDEVKTGRHPWYSLHRPRDKKIFNSPKLIGLTTTDRLIMALDTDGYMAMDALYVFQVCNLSISLYYLLAILNSNLLTFIYRYLAQEEGRILPQIKAENLYPLPVRLINFITIEEERKKLLEEGRVLYEKFLEREELSKVLSFIEIQLYAEPERSDIVHDLVAYLAEQMIEMNKQKHKEIMGFLSWLDGRLGIPVDELKNKTELKAYFTLSWQDFLRVLEENKRKIIHIDIESREPQELIKKHFEESLSKLSPLISRIQKTDKLIDQIVYKLYGLTDEEISIVER